MATFSVILLAAGRGTRLGGDVPKQYLPVNGKPLLYYSLAAFSDLTGREISEISEIILAVPQGDVSYCKENIVDRFGFKKVSAIIEGGAERYDSVFNALQMVMGDYVLIHDAARAMIDKGTIRRAMDAVVKYQTAVVGMPSKDTVKIVADVDVCESDTTAPAGNEASGAAALSALVKETPDRKTVWTVQTPQCFQTALVRDAYETMFRELSPSERKNITDDAMVVERFRPDVPVRMVEGSYRNIKITTREDVAMAERLLR